MAYSQKQWQDGEIITGAALNNIEKGIADLTGSYENLNNKVNDLTNIDEWSSDEQANYYSSIAGIVTLLNSLDANNIAF